MIFLQKIMKRLFSLLPLIFIAYLSCISPLKSGKLNFSDLPFYINDPDSYTMYLADRSRITPCKISSSDVPAHYTSYFRSDLFEEDKATFSQMSPKKSKKWIRIMQNSADPFLTVRLMMPNISSAEMFLERISSPSSENIPSDSLPGEGHTSVSGNFSFAGGMIIFPQNKRYAMIFTFGNAWKNTFKSLRNCSKMGITCCCFRGFL